jgi:RNA-binding protein YlmH
MKDETEFLKKRFSELSVRAFERNVWEYSSFLNLEEQSVLMSSVPDNMYFLYGGYTEAERKIAVFGDREEFGYDPAFPVKIIKFTPVNMKFSDNLTHRDVLGSVMSLGIERKTVGDILIYENTPYVFVLDEISNAVLELKKLKHTSVKAEICSFVPEQAVPKITEKEVTVSSLRLDCLAAAVFGLSRKEASDLSKNGRLFVDSAEKINPSFEVKEGSIVSVRGKGRFKLLSVNGLTKKGRLKITVGTYS